jgi:hypothetical protein
LIPHPGITTAHTVTPLPILPSQKIERQWEKNDGNSIALSHTTTHYIIYSTHPNYLLTSLFNMGVKANAPAGP